MVRGFRLCRTCFGICHCKTWNNRKIMKLVQDDCTGFRSGRTRRFTQRIFRFYLRQLAEPAGWFFIYFPAEFMPLTFQPSTFAPSTYSAIFFLTVTSSTKPLLSQAKSSFLYNFNTGNASTFSSFIKSGFASASILTSVSFAFISTDILSR